MPKLNSQEIISNVLERYPGLKKVYSPIDVEIIEADENRKLLNKQYGGGGSLEFWPKEEPGAPEFPHPIGQKKIALEIYDKSIFDNPEIFTRAIAGDLVHGMTKDPDFSKLREEFKSKYHPSTLAFEKNKGREMNESLHDAYIRGYLFPDASDEFGKAYSRGMPVWSSDQMETLGKMKRHLLGVPEPEVESIPTLPAEIPEEVPGEVQP